MAWKILEGNVLETLPTIEPGSIDCAVTSPPYFRLRSYLPKDHPLKPLELGSEATPEQYVENQVAVFRLVRECLADHGVCFVNIGDSYAQAGKSGGHSGNKNARSAAGGISRLPRITHLEEGNLCLIPQRLALALQADGWIVRSVIVWQKPAPMPASVSGWQWRRHRVEVTYEEAVSALRRVEAGQWVLPESEKQGWTANVLQAVHGCYRQAVQINTGRPGENAGTKETTTINTGVQDQKEKQTPKAKGARTKKGAGKSEQPSVSANGQSESSSGQVQGETQGAREVVAAHPDGGRVEGDQGRTTGEMLLVRTAGETSDGSCNPGDEGRSIHQGKHSRRVRPVQSVEGEQDSIPLLTIPCPGCKKCQNTGGYVLRRGSWRPTSAWEPILMLAKTADYFADGESVKTPAAAATVQRDRYTRIIDDPDEQFAVRHDHETICDGANLRDVWTIAAEPLKEKHYAAFPTELVFRCLAAATSAKGYCPDCGKPWCRVVDATRYEPEVVPVGVRNVDESRGDKTRKLSGKDYNEQASSKTIGWRPSCTCPEQPPRPGRVLDPFCGSGRTGLAAQQLGLDFTGCELNPDYVAMAGQLLGNNLFS